MRTCLKCGRSFSGAVALSMRDNTIICPNCGTKELLDRFHLLQILYPHGLNSGQRTDDEINGTEEKGEEEEDGK